MADVTDSGREGGECWPASAGTDRAQLVLVGGVVVAFALVALVLLLNTALFTENVATRGLGPGPDDAEGHVTFVEQSTNRIIRHEECIEPQNCTEYESWLDARKNATRNVLTVDTTVRAQQLQQHGAIAAVNLTSVNRGAVLIQNGSGAFVSESGDRNWTLANTSGIRNFSMTVDAGPTGNKSNPRKFTVIITGDAGDGSQWTAFVYENNSNVEVHANGKACRSTESVATINWTAGDLAGCSVPFAVDGSGNSLKPPYVLRFRNGTNATGTYHVAVRNETGGVRTGNFGAPGSGMNPRQSPAVYSINLTAIYEGSTIEYDTDVRVAPGESNRTRPFS